MDEELSRTRRIIAGRRVAGLETPDVRIDHIWFFSREHNERAFQRRGAAPRGFYFMAGERHARLDRLENMVASPSVLVDREETHGFRVHAGTPVREGLTYRLAGEGGVLVYTDPTMLNLRSALRDALLAALERAQAARDLPRVAADLAIIQYPPTADGSLGDYASPVAMAVANMTKKAPMAVLDILVKYFTPPEFVRKVEGVAPGFLNFYLDSAWLVKKLDDIVEEGARFGGNTAGQGRTINLEFVSANPTGLPSFGNGRALFWADTLGRALTASGYMITREYYVNDVGTQVLLYGESVLRRILQARGMDVPFPENLYQGAEVKVVADRVAERLEEDIRHTFSERDLQDADFLANVTRVAVEEMVNAIRETLERLCGVRYDVWTFEHTLHERGDVSAVLKDLKRAGATVEKDGAVWFRATAFGDDKDRVLVRKNGAVTYLVADIAYHRDKFRRGFSVIADFWGADHHGYIPRLQGALRALGEDVTRLRIVLAQIVHVIHEGEQKKMSKRAGTSVPLHEVVEQAGLSAARYFLIAKALSTHLDFDVDLAQEASQRNPVYYVQYAYVRLASLLRKAKENNILDGTLVPPLRADVSLTHPAEVMLMRELFRYPELVEDVAMTWDVQRIPKYASDLAKAIHLFYEAVPVLTADADDVKAARVTLAIAAKAVLGNTLDLLGVERREVM